MEMEVANVPVYWRTQARHAKFFEQKRSVDAKRWAAVGVDRAEYDERHRLQDPDGWYRWKYNDAIGWIRVFIGGRAIHFGIYLREEGRGRRASVNIAEYDGSATEVYWIREHSSQDYARKVIDGIRSIAKEEPLRKHFVDSADFEKFAKFVDWAALLDTKD